MRTATGGAPRKPQGQEPKTDTLVVGDIVRLLGERVEPGPASDAVRATAASLGIPGPAYDRDQVLAILAILAEGDGVLAVVARFAKARALLYLRP